MPDIDFTKLPPFHSPEKLSPIRAFRLARRFVGAMLTLYEHKPFLYGLLLEASPRF